MVKLLRFLGLNIKQKESPPGAGNLLLGPGTNYLPPVSRICLSFLGLALLLNCAAPMDRTRQLLELDLAHRSGAIKTLLKNQQTNPDPIQAYSLGVLYGADGDYEKMNLWFDRCSSQTGSQDQDILYIRHSHWRDEASAADHAAETGDWTRAASLLEKANQAAPEKTETWIRLVEARVMAFGPGLGEIRTLVEAKKPEVLSR